MRRLLSTLATTSRLRHSCCSCRGGSVPDRRHAADDGAARGDPRARPRDGRGRLRHDLARRGLPVVAEALDGGAVVDGALAAVARETERLAVGWGIISPFTRHPIQIAMEARVTQEAAGEGRFYLGLGVSKIFMRHAGIESKPVAAMKEAAEIIRGVLARRGGRPRRQGLLGAHPGAQGRRRRAALGRAALLRRHRPDDAARRRAGGRRAADRVDHDARVRPVRPRRARGGGPRSRFARPRLHDRRLDRRGSRPAAATARARSPACTSRTRCRTSRARPTRCSSAPG